jgi:hypothetical protein
VGTRLAQDAIGKMPDMPQDDEIERLWDEHMHAPFPPRLQGEELAGVDMVLLDADVAACVMTWRSDHQLDRSRQQLLRKLVADLDGTLPLLTDPEEIAYYGRLQLLATLIAPASEEPQKAP